MKLFQVTLSDQIVNELDLLKKTGWFRDENEIIQMALADFARLNRFGLAHEAPCDDARPPATAPRATLTATHA